MLSRVVVSARIDLFIAVCAVAASFALGVVIGGLAGYIEGDPSIFGPVEWRMVIYFRCSCWPMALVAALGNDLRNVVLATAIVNLPFYIAGACEDRVLCTQAVLHYADRRQR